MMNNCREDFINVIRKFVNKVIEYLHDNSLLKGNKRCEKRN